MAELTVVVG